MARVFISHASEDLGVALRIRNWLRDDHHVFLDRDLAEGLEVGEDWQDRLFEELRQADAVVCVVTAAFAASPWCSAEVGIASWAGIRLLPVRAEAGATHRLVAYVQYADLAGDPERARVELVGALARLDASGGAGRADGSPYPGLRAFDADMARLFFGRRAETRRLAELVRAPVEQAGAGLLAVVGPSGAGKSSLARAGLAPLVGADADWAVLPAVVPEHDPAAAVARALFAAGRDELGWVLPDVHELFGGDDGLRRGAADLLAARGASHLLVVVDQAEELFTSCDAATAARFARLLRAASAGPVRVVATLRSEFLDPLLTLASAAELRVTPFPLAPLEPGMLPLVVTGPARVAGIGVDDELLTRLVADTGGGDGLPLLAFVLAQLAEGVGRGGRLSAARYDALGGVSGALARQADAALATACSAGGLTTGQVLDGLLRLVAVDGSGTATRRRVDPGQLPEPLRDALEHFVQARLLTADRDDEGGGPVLTVAHEKILTEWKPLADAVANAADTLRTRNDVEDDATAWQARGRPDDHLWEQGRVDVAERVLAPTDVTPAGAQFLQASRRRNTRRRRRTIRNLGVLLVAALAAAVFGLTQWQVALGGERSAEHARLATSANALTVVADQLRDTDPFAALRYGAAAESIAETPVTAASLRGTLLDTSQIDAALTTQGAAFSVAFAPGGATLAVATATHQQGDSSGQGAVVLLDVADPAHPRQLGEPVPTGPVGVGPLAFAPGGATLAVATGQQRSDGSLSGAVVLLDLSDPVHPRRLGDPVPTGGAALSVAFAPGGATLAVATVQERGGSGQGAVVLLDVADPAHPRQLGEPVPTGPVGVGSLAFAPGGATLAATTTQRHLGGDNVNSWSSAVVLLDVSDPTHPRQLGEPIPTGGRVMSLAFAPGGATLGAATFQERSDGNSQGVVVLLDVTDLHHPRQLGEPVPTGGDAALSVAFAPGGATLAVATGQQRSDRSVSGAVVLLDVSHPAAPRQLGKPVPTTDAGGLGASAAFAPGGAVFAVASGQQRSDGSVSGAVVLLDVSDPVHPRRLGDPVPTGTDDAGSLAFAPGGATLAATTVQQRGYSSRGAVVLLDVADPAHPHRLGDPVPVGTDDVGSLAFAPGGATLAAATRQWEGGSWSGAVVLLDVSDRTHPRQLGEPVPTGGDVGSVAFAPGGATLAAATTQERGGGNSQGAVVLIDVSDPAHPHRLGDPVPTGTIGVGSLAFAPGGATLAAATTQERGGGNSQGAVVLLNVSDPAHPHRLGDPVPTRDIGVGSLAFAPGGATLAATNLRWDPHKSQGAVVLIDVTDPAHAHQLGDPIITDSDTAGSLAFAPDGATLVTTTRQRGDSSNSQGAVVLIDVTDPHHPHQLGDPIPAGTDVGSVAFAPGGATLAATTRQWEGGSRSGAVVLLDVTELTWSRVDRVEAACRRTGGVGLAQDDWNRYVPDRPYRNPCSK
ncbi:TIR domain-containing protein [Frankia sp. CiP3]|uniref:nSTAND1 domain-containing NTPase n=1 Tax=Frankia sp. CiP3 TaxID=2880971 RepID=UPI001EF626DE|nr:TIR domain-containing protein [Frankia sp. CiP3]